MARVTKVLRSRNEWKCEKCGAAIPIGAPYLWWQFRFGGKHVRCAAPECAPQRQDLTQSEFWISVWNIEDTLTAAVSVDDLQSVIDEVESLHGETEDSLSNMPEGLQEGSILQGRIDSLQEWQDELQSALDNEPAREDSESDEDFSVAFESWLEEVHSLGYNGE